MVLTTKATKNHDIQASVSILLQKLNIDFQDIEVFILAFVHRSIVNERSDFTPEHNERLEFLGDAVLELCITEKLYTKYTQTSEGDMTDMRSALVRGKNLAKISKKLGFQDHLLLGKGEEKSGGRSNDYILANTFEAFLGALYLDKGLERTKKFIDEHVYGTLSEITKKRSVKDYKTLLQEYTQGDSGETPSYKVISEEGPDHDKSYIVGVYIGEKKLGEGTGTSKKKGQELAAKNAFLSLTTPKG